MTERTDDKSNRQYGDAFEFWWQGHWRGDYIHESKAIAWEAWKASAARSAPSARNTILDECATALYERVESLVTMCDRAGYTREGSDLAQRVTATRDAIDIVRRLKSASTDGTADK